MSITIPGSGGAYTDLVADKSLFSAASIRGLHRSPSTETVKTERMRIASGQFTYKGVPQRLWMTTLSFGACRLSTDALRSQLVEEIRARGHNLVRLHHFDAKAASGGILKDSPSVHWHELDATASGYLVETIKKLREAGIWYSLDFNSIAGTSFLPIEGADAAAIHPSATSIEYFKSLPPVNQAASAQLKAYAAAVLALDLGHGATLATDPHLLYATITNEHLLDEFQWPPYATFDPDSQLALDAWKGSAWTAGSSSDRTLYGNACKAYAEEFRKFLISRGCQTFLAWGSEFGTQHTEYDALKANVDVKAVHLYCPVTGQIGDVLDPREPSQQMTSLTNLKLNALSHHLPRVSGPYVLEEYQSADPNPYKAEAIPYAAAFCRLNEWAACGYFDYADGSWDPTTVPPIRQYQTHTDRAKDSALALAASIYLRGDLEPISRSTATNRAFEDRNARTWGIDTPRTIAFCGPAGSNSGTNLQLNQKLSNLSGHRALLFVTSFDLTPLREATRMLIGHITDVQRRNRVFSDDLKAITNMGSGNMCNQQGEGEIRFYCAYPSKCVVYALKADGTRDFGMSLAVNGNLVTFTATNVAAPVMLYEVECAGAATLLRRSPSRRRRF